MVFQKCQRLLGCVASMALVLSAILLPSTKLGKVTLGSASIAHATISWTGGSAAGSGAAPWETFSGSVNLTNGNLMVSGGGPSLAGVNGLDQVITPVYNSVSAANSTDMGNGWILTPGRDVGLLITSGSATFYDETGHGWVFTKSGSTFTSPAGIDATLVQNPDGTYALTENASAFQYQFDSGGYLTALQNREGNRITFAYDANGRLTQVTNTEGQVTTVGYDAQNRVSSITDPANRVWSYSYDSNNNLTQITDPASNHASFSYDSSSRLTQIVDPNGNKTLLSYGSMGVSQVVNVTNPTTNTGPTTKFSYTTGYGAADVTDPNGNLVSHSFDSSHRLTQILGVGAVQTDFSWNSDNQITQVIRPSGTTTYAYDANNNLTQVTLPTGASASWQYSNPSFPYLPSSATDTQGNTSTVGYNSQGLVTSVTDPTGHSQSFTYNSNGTLASETDENGNTTTHTYTAQGLPSQDTPPAPLGSTSYAFNSADLESSVTDGKGQLSTFSYDSLGQVTGVGFADGTSLGYAYDANGNVLSMTDSTGTTNYTYDALDRLTKKTLPNGQTVSYSYDNSSNLLTKTDSAGTISYTYTAHNLVSSVTDRQSHKTTLGYDASDRMTSMAFPNGITQKMTYNNDDQLTRVYAQNSGLATLTSFTYSYTNPATNKVTELPYSLTDVANKTTSYTYDTSNQLTQAVQKNSGGTTLNSYAFGYDPAGNLNSKTINGTLTNFTYNAANELTQASGGMNMTYSYDGNGDLVSRSDGTSLQINAAGQITSITPPGGSAVNMTYTGVGETQRVGRGSTTYQYDAAGMSQQTDGSTSTNFTNLPDGTLISETVSGSTYYYLTDGAGSVVALTDGSGALKNQYSYDPLGNATCSSCTVSNPITFQGGIFDSQTGFYYTGSGYYDPATGQDFGCKDKGWVDPGEDLCGGDEADETSSSAPQSYRALSEPGPSAPASPGGPLGELLAGGLASGLSGGGVPHYCAVKEFQEARVRCSAHFPRALVEERVSGERALQVYQTGEVLYDTKHDNCVKFQRISRRRFLVIPYNPHNGEAITIYSTDRRNKERWVEPRQGQC